MSQRFEKLKTLLQELFQLDQPDLDFGFYRIMHAKSAEVTQFLENDLLPQVKSAFAQYQPADKAAIAKELAQAVEAAQSLGVDPEQSPKVKDLRTRLANEAVDLNALEAEVYDHIHKDLGGFLRREPFSYPKSIYAVIDATYVGGASLPTAILLDYFAGSGTTGHAVINLNREDGGRRKFILVEMGNYFDTVLLPRIKKVTFSPEWKDGKPKRLATAEEAERSPRIIKVVRLESYEDMLNNLETRRTREQQSLLDLPQAQGPDGLKEQYLLRYMLDVETHGNPSLLNMAALTNPTAYKLKVKRPGSDESREVSVDLLETFNWLIGLTVQRITAPRTFSAAFERDQEGRLRLKGRLKPISHSGVFSQGEREEKVWWFRTVAGAMPDGRKTLVIWRRRPGGETPEGIEQDNLVLDEWFTAQGYSSKDSGFALIYVNGDYNLENLKAPDDIWKVRLIEEDFHRLMFGMEGT